MKKIFVLTLLLAAAAPLAGCHEHSSVFVSGAYGSHHSAFGGSVAYHSPPPYYYGPAAYGPPVYYAPPPYHPAVPYGYPSFSFSYSRFGHHSHHPHHRH